MQYKPLAKHSQYNFKHFEWRQLHPRVVFFLFVKTAAVAAAAVRAA